jgi:hypothetical protein
VSIIDGVAPLKLNLRFTAAATLTVVADNCETVRMTGCVRDSSGSGVISFPVGVKSVVSGATNVANDKTNFSAVLQSDVTFADQGGMLVFTNDIVVAKRVTCNWSAAKGSRLVLMEKRAIADGDFELSNYNVHIAHTESFAKGAKITVPSGRTLIIRPFSFKNPTTGEMVGINGASVTNDVELAGGTVAYYNNNSIKGLTGAITGAGNVSFSGNGALTAFTGGFDWEGDISASGGTEPVDYTFVTTNGATIRPAIKKAAIKSMHSNFQLPD